jgi:trimeric autotransporter adhesin
MTISVSQISNTQTFGAWLTTTNRLAEVVSQNTVTADSTSTGSVTTGNSFVNGHFGSQFLYVANTLSGGQLNSAGPLRLLANVAVANSISNVFVVTSNSTSSNLVISGNVSFIGSTILANGSSGSSGQVLTSNGAGLYWSTVDGVNTAFGYTWTGVQTFNANVVFGSSTRLFANGTVGTSGQALFSNGAGVYWANVVGGATLTANNTDTQSFFFPMANTTSGTWSNGVVSDAKLFFVPSTGVLSATIFNSLSDEAEKNDIVDVTEALTTVRQLRGVEFNWRDNGEKSSGVIAQELEMILPHLVIERDDIRSVNYNGIIAYLIEAIKELTDRLENLEGK